MKPTKKRAGLDIPDLNKEELLEQVGGTDGDIEEDLSEQYLEGDEDGGGAYGRPRELGDEEEGL